MTVNKTELWRRKVALWIVVGFVTIVSLFFIFGCKNTKEVIDSKIKNDVELNHTQNDTFVSNDVHKDNSTLEEKSVNQSDVETEKVEREFSAPATPDGNPVLVKETTTRTINSSKGTNERNLKSNLTDKRNSKAESKDKLAMEDNTKEKIETESTSKSSYGAITFWSFVGTAVVAGIFFFIKLVKDKTKVLYL